MPLFANQMAFHGMEKSDYSLSAWIAPRMSQYSTLKHCVLGVFCFLGAARLMGSSARQWLVTYAPSLREHRSSEALQLHRAFTEKMKASLRNAAGGV